MPGQSFGSASVVDAGGGWWRINLTGTLPEGGATAILGVLSGGNRTFAGDGTSAVLVWGPDLTQGVDQARPFTLTQGAIAGPMIFNPPVALTPGGVEMWAAVAGGANWAGANAFVSYDGSTYEEVGVINGGARFGALTASFAAGSDPDTVNTLSVDLSASEGVIETASQAAADAAGSLCLINDATPELIAYETATPTAGGNRYNLTTYIRRGVENTPIGSHASQAPFVRLDQAVFDFPYLATQGGKQVFVKFQSFNAWGAQQDLANCIAYAAVPVPLGVRPPTSAAWTATPTTITNAGSSVPAILITGKSDNLSASAVEFFYRVTGTSAWVSAGTTSNSATQFTIAPVAANQTYDVAVAYVVNGVLGQLQIITPGGGSQTGGGGSGGAPGTALLNDSAPGAGKTFTIPASFTGAHVDIVLVGLAGSGAVFGSGGGGKSATFTDYGGGGGGTTIAKGFPAAAGLVFTYTLPSTVGSDATVTATGLSLASHSGTSASNSPAEGAGAAASTGNTATGAASLTAYAGRNGGLTDTWDGGGPGATIDIASGTVTTPGPDNTTDGNPGAIPGQGGSGSVFGVQPGGGCQLLIIARA